MFQSRNTLFVSAFAFLIVVLLLRLSGGFFEENIVRVTGAIFAGNAESIPLIDFGAIGASFEWSALNPMQWDGSGIREGFNGWLHDTIDTVVPAVITLVNVSLIHWIGTLRVDILGAILKVAPAGAAVA